MTDMSSADHYDAAEKLLEEAESYREPDTRAEWCLELAKVHLALSQASLAAGALHRREKAPATPAGTAGAGSPLPTEPAPGSERVIPESSQTGEEHAHRKPRPPDARRIG
jgi:hypothetical protein